MHIPVLLNEVIEYLKINPGERYIDATIGGGGHAREIVKAGGLVLGIDRDPEVAEKLKTKNEKLKVLVGSFLQLKEVAEHEGFAEVSGILFDLGLGSHQLDDPKRGFSFQKDGPLDMRFDTTQEKRTAQWIVNKFDEKDLRKIFREYGEERYANRIARRVLEQRKAGSINTTSQLFEIIKKSIPAKDRYRAGDVARRIFQSLRIEVNHELKSLEMALPQAVHLLRPGGRLVVISFHSLEDRIVKRFMAQESKDCICPPEVPVCNCGKSQTLKVLTRKPVVPSEEEMSKNSRSKSAKLRAAKKTIDN